MDAQKPDLDPASLAGKPATRFPITLPATTRRREADEWALVLTAEGFAPEIVRSVHGFSVDVAPELRADASRILEAWQLERSERERRLEPPPTRASTSFDFAVAYALALGLLAFHLGLESAARSSEFVELGASDAGPVLKGQWWRLVTALTLHSDLPHVLGNTLFGGFFLAALTGRLGLGVGLLAFVVTGTLGNLANALYYGSAHSSIGASTGVFGLVGVLTGLAAWQRHHFASRGRGAWVAFGAGLGILAMLGTGGPRVDVTAHLFGLGVGALTGILLAAPLATRPHPGRAAQVLAFLGGLGLILSAWARAHGPLGP